jgi:hypothetical protein
MVADSRPFGSFIPTSNIWDTNEILDLDIDDQFKEVLIRLYQNLNRMALLVNQKETGFYPLQPFVTSNIYFPSPTSTNASQQYRSVYRQTINFGALPDTGTKSVPHHIPITLGYTFVHIYGGSSDPTDQLYIPLPYASNTAGDSIELFVNSTDVVIITGSDRSNFTDTKIVLEYLQF